MFHQLSKHLEFRQKYSAARRIFNSLLGVWISDETLFLVFDILREAHEKINLIHRVCLFGEKPKYFVVSIFKANPVEND